MALNPHIVYNSQKLWKIEELRKLHQKPIDKKQVVEMQLQWQRVRHLMPEFYQEKNDQIFQELLPAQFRWGRIFSAVAPFCALVSVIWMLFNS